MSRTILKIIPLLLLISSGFQCKRNNDTNILTGRLVISDGCGQAAVEVLSGQFDPLRVVASWKDPDNDSIYHNVFGLGGVRNACAIGYFGVSKGDTFQFRMDPSPQFLECNTCMIRSILALPPVFHAVKDVKK